jgi:hypothetical protein
MYPNPGSMGREYLKAEIAKNSIQTGGNVG